MTDQAPLTLDDIRVRFLEAQSQLTDAASAVETIRHAAERLGSAREGLSVAGTEIAALAERFGSVADAMAENADRLREGVDAIRLGDPAAIRQQIQELDAAFTAMQEVMGTRFGALEAAEAETKRAVGELRVASATATRYQLITIAVTLVGFAILGILLLVR